MPSAGDDGVVDPRAHSDAGADAQAPFDPGSAGYDRRRARREAKRRARVERRLLERAERVERKVAVPPPAAAAAGQSLAAGGEVEVQSEPRQPEPAPQQVTTEPEPAEVVELRPTRPRRESIAERLERQRITRERADAERRTTIEHERAARERAE